MIKSEGVTKNSYKLPSFILVGVAKCGTSFILKYLMQHPNIYLPNTNELYFHSHFTNYNGPFDKPYLERVTKTFDDYRKNFEAASPNQVIGEIATDYLYAYKRSIPSIKKYIGNPKILICLRNPVERTFSHYRHLVSKFEEPLSFFEALEKEEERMRQGWRWAYQYSKISMYHDQVKAFLENFENVKILLFDDLRENPKKFIDSIYEFIGVEKKHFKNINERVNIRIIQKSKKIFYMSMFIAGIERKCYRKSIVGKLIVKLNEKKLSLTESEKERLYKEKFKTEIDKLEELLNRDLSMWRYD